MYATYLGSKGRVLVGLLVSRLSRERPGPDDLSTRREVGDEAVCMCMCDTCQEKIFFSAVWMNVLCAVVCMQCAGR
jgi:hypothetical protein